jgi:hypothetical protein
MEQLRRLAQGRLAEVLGPFAIAIDHTFRLLDPGRAVGGILRDLPGETHSWLEAFVAGINHHISFAAEPNSAQQALAVMLDRNLARRNLDYEAHRAGMRPREILAVPRGTLQNGCAAAASSARRTRCRV